MRAAPKIVFLLFVSIIIFISASTVQAGNKGKMLFHLKTSLGHDDAQLCVAYNEIWAALAEGYSVNVLVDSGAVNTYKTGWRGKDKIEAYKLPQNLKKQLSEQFGVAIDKVPATYGDYLEFLHQSGARFYINATMLVVADIKSVSADFFKPLDLKDMIRLRGAADFYMTY